MFKSLGIHLGIHLGIQKRAISKRNVSIRYTFRYTKMSKKERYNGGLMIKKGQNKAKNCTQDPPCV